MHPVRTLALAIAVSLAAPVMAQAPSSTAKPAATPAASGPTASDMEILRQKLKADKKLLIAENMQLTEAEAKAFWPLYDEYQTSLNGINERTKKTIAAYASVWNTGTTSPEVASKLATEALAIEDEELKLKRATFAKVEKAIGGLKAARYMQIENKIRALVKMELAAQIPLAR